MARREIPEQWRVLMDRKGIPSLRRLSERAGLGHTTVNRIVFSEKFDYEDETLQAIADALEVDFSVVYRLAGKNVKVADRWEPPAISARMTPEQRQFVGQLIEMLVNGHAPVHHPEQGAYRLAADTSHGPTPDQQD